MNNKIHFRKATILDVDLYFKWSNDKSVRENSYNNNVIDYQNHVNWFASKLALSTCFFYLFLNENEDPIGQVRIEKFDEETVIGISIDELHRGGKHASNMISMTCNDYLKLFKEEKITAYIKIENVASYKSFVKAGFNNESQVIKNETISYKLERTNHE